MNRRLDPHLSALLQKEREHPDPPHPAKERVWARVGATLAMPAPPSAHPAPSSAPGAAPASIGWVAAVSVALVGGASGVLLAFHTMSASPAALPTASASAPATAFAFPVVAFPTATASAAQSASVRTLPVAPTTSSPARPPGATDLAAERLLLDRARAELLRGEGTAALGAVTEHSNRFPRGVLAEERDALRVEALVAAARYDEARAWALKFHAAHPGSLLTSAVDDALGAIP